MHFWKRNARIPQNTAHPPIMKTVYSSKDIRQLKKALDAKRKLDRFKKANWFWKILTCFSGLTAFCKLSHVESSYFKPRMEKILNKNGISKIDFGTSYDFERFQYFVAHQDTILSEISNEATS